MDKLKLKKSVQVGGAVLGAVLLTVTSPVNAQDSSRVIEEIIVTAQKRAENIQDVPMTVNVVSSDSLDDFEIYEFSSLEELVTGVSITGTHTGSNKISIRGITYDNQSNAATSVDVYWNEIRIHPQVAFNQLFDMERVEVLKGPQGALQGRAAPAGNIMLVTRKADVVTGESDGVIKTAFDTNDGALVEGAVSIPLIPGKLASRVAGVYDKDDHQGYENITNGRDQYYKAKGGRVSFSWQPLGSLDVELVAEKTDKEVTDNEPVTGSGENRVPIDVYDRIVVVDGPVKTDYDGTQYGLKMNWEVINHQLTVVSGYIESRNDQIADLDYSNVSPGAARRQIVDTEMREISHEVRIASVDSGFWEYMLGVYYYEKDQQTDNIVDLFAADGTFNVFVDIPIKEEEISVFTHHKFHLTDRLTTQAGLRWQEFEKFNRTDVYNGRGFGAPFGSQLFSSLISEENTERTFDAVTGSLQFSYDFTDNLMGYISYQRGYRPGGITISGASLSQDLLLFEEEVSNAFELGVKTMLLQQKLQLNAAIFRQHIQDYITLRRSVGVDDTGEDDVPDGTGDGVVDKLAGITVNNDVTIQGVELEGRARMGERWSLDGGFIYSEARFDGGALPCNRGPMITPPGGQVSFCDVDGDRIGGEPEIAVNLGTEYVIGDWWKSADWYIRALYKYTGQRRFEDLERSGLGGYSVTNLYAGVRSKDDTWEVSLWVKNLFDKEAQRELFPEDPENPGYRFVSIIQERIAGLSVSYNFRQ